MSDNSEHTIEKGLIFLNQKRWYLCLNDLILVGYEIYSKRYMVLPYPFMLT